MTDLRTTPPIYLEAPGPAPCCAPDFQGEYCINHAPTAYQWLKGNYSIEKRTRWVDIWRRVK